MGLPLPPCSPTSPDLARARTCAVVVTYHPDALLIQRLNRVLPQVGQLLIVDNHSSPQVRATLQDWCQVTHAELLANPDNLGIATALNQGARRACALSFAWLLMLDQDTWVEPNLLDALATALAATPDPARIGIIGPGYCELPGDFLRQPPPLSTPLISPAEYAPVPEVFTSGSVLRLTAYAQAGPFRENFFIDRVDIEYCLRLRVWGFSIIKARKPLIQHFRGQKRVHRLLGRNVTCTHHSVLRRYYITRNRLYVLAQYFRQHPCYLSRDMYYLVKETAFIVLFEEHKLKKLLATALGIWHFLLHRTGRIEYTWLD